MSARALSLLVVKLVLCLVLWAPGTRPAHAAEAESEPVFRYAPKLSFRFDGGFMKNIGTAGGTGGIAWGLNALGLYYPGSSFALGVGYRTSFDLIKGTTPVSGFFFPLRWYFLGEGTRVRTEGNRMTVQRHENFAFYTGLEVGQSGYYLGESARRIADQLTGSYFNMNGLLGADLRLSESFEVNLEGSLGLLVLASTDEKFRIKGRVFNIGISYLW